jgi:NADH-quinone oxidoreductase subunit L
MVNVDILTTLVPVLPLLGFLIISWRVKKLQYGTTVVIACGVVLVSFIISAALCFQLLDRPEDQRFIEVTLFDWIQAGNFTAKISFLVDPLSSVMLLIITGVGFLIHVYSLGYMQGDDGFNRFFSYLNLFVFFMLLLVMGSNYLLMFVGWEGVGLCSYLLIGFWFKNKDYTDAANKAFIMNRVGDLGLIIGVILIFIQFGSIEYQQVFVQVGTRAMGSPVITLITVLLFIGAMGKSAQIPLYTWLPDAMAGPTPVSALIHAATMVTAGIYMVARNNILYTLAPFSQSLVLVVGLATALFAATIALTQNDIKKVLAYSTVSQLGLMFVALGVGAYSSGIFHMMTHAFFKALLFLAAGSVIHGMQGVQDIRKMGGLRKYLPTTHATFLIGVLAISGIPPFAGFFSKDEILARAFEVNPVIWGIALLASLLTAFYMFRLLFLTFYGEGRAGHDSLHHIHESPASMTLPLIALAVLSTVGGWIGIPEALSGSNRIHEFLNPVFAKSQSLMTEDHLDHATEYTLMTAVIVLTLAMIVIAYLMYVKRNNVPVEEGAKLNPVHEVVYNKYFVDELYDRTIVKPLYWIASMLDSMVERLGIDRLVNSAGNAVVDGSSVVRLLQTGNIGFYVFAMVVGIILMLATTLIMK